MYSESTTTSQVTQLFLPSQQSLLPAGVVVAAPVIGSAPCDQPCNAELSIRKQHSRQSLLMEDDNIRLLVDDGGKMSPSQVDLGKCQWEMDLG